MLQRKQRKNFVDLLKCSRAQFTNKALRFLLFANSSQRTDLFYEVTHNGLLKQKFSTQLYGNDLTLLGNQVLSYNAKMSSDDAIDYACFLVDLYGQQINKYILLREQYEQFYLSQNYTSAIGVLNKIENEVCVSLWSCGQRLLLSELEHGLESNKETLEFLNKTVPQNYATLAILHHYSCLAELDLSFENYQIEIAKFLKPIENMALGKYLTQKLSLSATMETADISLVLQIDSQFSVIDIYNDLEIIIPLHYKDNIKNGSYDFPFFRLNSIQSPFVNNLKMLDLHVEKTGGSLNYSENEKSLYQIIELYTCGKYEQTIDLAKRYLKIKPFAFQVAVIFCKALLNSNEVFPDDLNISYIKNIYSIYKMDCGYREAIQLLLRELKQNHGSILRIKIQSFLARKHLLDINHDYSFVSSLLDESLHPNFMRFLSGETRSRFWNALNSVCPISISLACALKTSTINPIVASQVEKKRLAIFNAEKSCNNGDIRVSAQCLETLEKNCSPDDWYMQERIKRIQLKLYSLTCDYHSAVCLFVDCFFENEYLFERLLSGNYIQIPMRMRENTIEADLHYVIFVYLLNRNDYSRQIRAYNNYLELNHYATIFDALKAFEKNANRLNTFFFHSICSIALLKRDVGLCEHNITPENARLKILRTLHKISPLKQYSNEINNISTFEVMRDNLNSINKSRINVDVDKILQQHQDQWQETYQKYLKLSRSSHKFIGIDFSEHEASIQFAKLAENLNIQIKNSPQISQETLVLRSILEQILEECLFSTQYGLETYLSSRIRHGYCRGQLTSFLRELHLVSLRDKEDDSYHVNPFWDAEFKGDKGVLIQVKNVLSDFTALIEKKIDEICKEWLRIKYKDSSNGMFDYSTLTDICIVACQREPVEEFSIFYNRIVALFWVRTNALLKEIQERITGELQNFYINAIENLEKQLREVAIDQKSENSMKKLLSYCTVSKAKVIVAMEQFKDVFSANNAHYNNFTMRDLSSSCKKVIQRLYADSEDVAWKMDADDTLLLNGKYFVSFVDILCILLNNSLTHSGFNQIANLEIDITATQVTEQEKSELIDIIPAFHSGHQHIMRLQVKNNLSKKINESQLEQRLETIFCDIRKEQLDRKLVQGEGGSGLHKLCKTIDYNIEVPYYIGYEIDNHSISLSYVFVADDLLYKEE